MKSTGLWSLKKILALPLFSILLLFPFQNCNRFKVASLDESSIASGVQSLTTFEQINSQIIIPKCISCHGGTAPSGGIDLSSYSKLMESSTVIPYDYERSLFYTVLANGSMPVGGPAASPATLAGIKAWITGGALENELAPPECIPSKKVLPRLSHYEYENILGDILGPTFNPTFLKNLPELPPLFGFDNISDSKIDRITAEAYYAVAENMADQLMASTAVISRCQQRPFYLQTWENCAKDVVSFVAEKLYRRPLRASEVQGLQTLFQTNLNAGMSRIRTSTDVLAGNLDIFMPATGQIAGWSYDPDWPERSVELQFFAKPSGSAGIGTYIGSALANSPRSDVNSVTGILGDRGYVFNVPAAYLNGQVYTVAVKAVGNSIDMPVLNSPINIQGTAVTPPSQKYEFSLIFTDSLRSVLIATLLSPNFLYKMEYFPGGYLPEENSFKNAARLSLAIGSTYPDAEAMTLAKAGQYTNQATLSKEAERLLVKHGSRFSLSFGGQWLGFRKNLKKANTTLDYSMAMESKLVLEKVIADDLLASKLLEPGFSFVNSGLANHYQIPGSFMPGSFSMVPSSQRGGLLNQGQFLTRTATALDSHPIKRGIWVLDTLLCAALPALSAATFEEIAAAQAAIDQSLPLSERMKAHRSTSARCNTCHYQIDPVGLALENWDRNGIYRTTYADSKPVISGLLFNGTRVTNPFELAHAVADSSMFRNCVKRKINAYLRGVNPTQPERCTQSSVIPTDESIRKLTTDTMVESLLKEQ